MAKVLTKDIAKVLAEKKGLSYEEAEGYVNSFFSLVDDSLIPEKIVKIKGFGTFKLIDVRDRESVDVNTGERMVIDGHSKISFTPDSTFKDLVNKPFSQFETVVMNDSAEIERILQHWNSRNMMGRSLCLHSRILLCSRLCLIFRRSHLLLM